MNKSCVAACLESVRMAVESVSGCSWNECPDQRGITVRMCVEWVSESAWNPHGVGGAVFFGLELAVAVGLGGVVTLITDADFMVVLDISSQSHWAWRSAGYGSQAENRR